MSECLISRSRLRPCVPFAFRFVVRDLHLNVLTAIPGKDCGFPGRPGNGSTIGAEKFFYPGEEVTFQCDNGYILFGADRRICQEDGSWSGALPECSKPTLTITRHNTRHRPLTISSTLEWSIFRKSRAKGIRFKNRIHVS